jgi:hypothetical protein
MVNVLSILRLSLRDETWQPFDVSRGCLCTAVVWRPGTTWAMAEKRGWQGIGCDVGRVAIHTISRRSMRGAGGAWAVRADSSLPRRSASAFSCFSLSSRTSSSPRRSISADQNRPQGVTVSVAVSSVAGMAPTSARLSGRSRSRTAPPAHIARRHPSNETLYLAPHAALRRRLSTSAHPGKNSAICLCRPT